MSRNGKWLLVKAIAALVVIGLLLAGGLAVHYLGWSQGYAAGQLAAEGEEGATLPYLPRGLAHPGRPFGFTPLPFCLGLFLQIGLLLLLLGLIGKIVRFFLWPMAMCGPMSPRAGWRMDGPWARHWRRFHGPVPPWWWEKPTEEEADADKPGDETGDA